MASGKKPNARKTFFQVSTNFLKPEPPEGYQHDELPEYNWKADRQPLQLADFSSHIDVNKALVPAYLSLMADIVIAAGYAPPAEKTAIVRGMMQATGYETDERGIQTNQKKEFKLPGVSFFWRIKTLESCAGKVLNSMKEGKAKDQNSTGDYFGCKLIGDTIDDIVRLRNAARLIEHGMTSRRCEYSHPSTEGFRSHKSHHLVSAEVKLEDLPKESRDMIAAAAPPGNKTGHVQLFSKGELMIMDRPSEQVEAFTHSLKNAERALDIASHEFAKAVDGGLAHHRANNSLSTRMSRWSDEIKSVRIFCNDAAAWSQGLDALTAPGKERGIPQPPQDISPRTRSNILNIRSGIPDSLEPYIADLLGPRRLAHVKDGRHLQH